MWNDKLRAQYPLIETGRMHDFTCRTGQDVHNHHMSWTAPTALYKSVLQVSQSFILCFMLALPLHVMSVLAVNLLVSDDCLVSGSYACELKCFFMFLLVNQLSAATEFSYQEAVCYHS